MDYKKSATEIIKYLGGIENISSVTHCMTRLRVTLHKEELFDADNLKKIKLVKGVNINQSQFQVILGTGVVNKVFKEVISLVNNSGVQLNEAPKSGNFFQQLSRVFGDIFIPIIPVIIASGILLGLKSFLLSSGILVEGSNWLKISSVIIDTGFAFLPVLVAWSATKKFGGTAALGIVIGLMLVSPIFPSPAAVAKGNAEPLLLDFLGITFQIVNFQGSILVAVGAGLILSATEKLVSKIIPNVLDMILTPILSLLITFFVIYFGIGPILNILEGWLVSFFELLFTLPLGIGGFIIGGLQQVLVITGLHHALWIIDINFIEDTGMNLYQPIRNASVLGQTGAALGFVIFALVNKYKQTRSRAFAASVGGLFGITEPVIFGFTLNYGRPFLYGCLGSAIGGMFSTALNLAAPGMGTAGVTGLLYFIGDTAGLTLYIIQSLITLTIPLVLTVHYLRKNKIEFDE